MSTVTKSWAPTRTDPAAAAARKKKILAAVLFGLLAAILAFEVPRMLHSSSPPSAPTASAEPGQTGLVTDQIGDASATVSTQNAATDQAIASGEAATGTATPVAGAPTAPRPAAPAVSRATILAIRHRPAKDPFVPLLGPGSKAAAAASTQPAPPVSPAQPATTAAAPPAPAAVPSLPAEKPKAEPSVSTPVPARPTAVEPTPKEPAAKTPVPSKPAATTTPATIPAAPAVEVRPNAAVVYANGNREAVGVGQYFEAGDLWFHLLEV